MAGNSNSGRRSGLTTNQMKLRADTIEKCWTLIAECVQDTTLDKKFRAELAAKLAVKSLPQEVTGDLGVRLSAMGTITYGGQEAVFKIGSQENADNPPEDPEPSS